MVSVLDRHFFFAGIFFLAVLSLQLLAPHVANATDLTVSETDYRARFRKGTAAFERGAFDEARSIFSQLLHLNPSDPDVNFYLGRSAFETGDFEGAVFAFERILIEAPDNQRVTLEMARAYMEMGSLDEASRLFNTVLATKPPTGVQATIFAFLARIEQKRKKHFFSGAISFGLNLDSNVYVAPTEDIVTVPALDDLPVSLGKPESDVLVPLIFQAMHTYKPLDSPYYWTSSVQTYHTRYEDHDDLNVDYFGARTGMGRRMGKWEVGLFPEGYIMTLGGDRYSEAWGAGLSCSVSLGKKHQIGASVQALKKRFSQIDGRDGNSVTFEGQGQFVLGKVGISPFVSFKNENADLSVYSYDRLGAGISFSIPMLFKTTLFSGYLFERDEYDGRNLLFETTRKDDTHLISLGLSKAFRLGKRSQCVVRLAQSWDYSNSNIPLYDYDRNVSRLSVSFIF